MVNELRAALADVAGDKSVRALAISGAGGHFSAGGMKDMARAEPREACRR